MELNLVSRIGKKIKRLRQENNLTLHELSRKSNISKSLLSKIENGRTIPSLPVTLSIIQALEVSLKDFFEDMGFGPESRNFLHIRKELYKPYEKENRMGFLYHYIMGHSFANISLEVAVLEISPDAESQTTTTDGFEFKYMLEGELEYHLQEQVIQLKEGDSLFFDASSPHLPVNKSGKMARMLVLYFMIPKAD